VTSLGFNPDWSIMTPLLRLKAVAAELLGARQAPGVFGVFLALAAIAALSGRLRFFLLWSLAALLPYLDVLPLQGLSRAMSTKDFQPRYALLACAALSWAAAAGLARWSERGGWQRRASQVLVLLLALAACWRLNKPLRYPLPEVELTRFLSLPFVRAADPRAYEALLQDAASKYGAKTAAAFAELSGSGLLYEDPDAAGFIRHAVYALEMRPISDARLSEDFLAQVRLAPDIARIWSRARELLAQDESDAALPLLQEVLRRDPSHAQAALAASAVLLKQGRTDLAKRLYLLARDETGLGQAALLSVACGRLGPACGPLGLAGAEYRQAMGQARLSMLDTAEPFSEALAAEDRDLLLSYSRAMAANEHRFEAERARAAALGLAP
jgi:hypothetical protein